MTLFLKVDDGIGEYDYVSSEATRREIACEFLRWSDLGHGAAKFPQRPVIDAAIYNAVPSRGSLRDADELVT